MAKVFKFGNNEIQYNEDVEGFVDACRIARQIKPQIINRFETEFARYESIEDICSNVISLTLDCIYRFYLQYKNMFNERGMSGSWDDFVNCGKLDDLLGDIVDYVNVCGEEINRLDNCQELGESLNQLNTDIRRRYHNYSSGGDWVYGAIGAGMKNLVNYGFHKAKQSHDDSELAKKIKKKKDEMFDILKGKILPTFPDRINLLFQIIKDQLDVDPKFSSDFGLGLLSDIKNDEELPIDEKNKCVSEILQVYPIGEDVYQYIFENLDEEHIEDALIIASFFEVDISNAYNWLCKFDGKIFSDWHQSNWLRCQWKGLISQLHISGCSSVLIQFLDQCAKCEVEDKTVSLTNYAVYCVENEIKSFQVLADIYSKEHAPENFNEAEQYLSEQRALFIETRDNLFSRLELTKDATFAGVLFSLEKGFLVGDSNKLYIGEKIPDRKLRNVLLGYAKDMGIKRKDVWVLWDETTFGSGNEGFIFTHDKIVFSSKDVVDFKDIVEIYHDTQSNKIVYKNRDSDEVRVLVENVPENNRICNLVHFMYHPASMDNNCLEFLEKDKDGSIAIKDLLAIDDADEEKVLKKERKDYRKSVIIGGLALAILGKLVFDGVTDTMERKNYEKERIIRSNDKIIYMDKNTIKNVTYYADFKDKVVTPIGNLFDGNEKTVWKYKNEGTEYVNSKDNIDYNSVEIIFTKKQKIVGCEFFPGNQLNDTKCKQSGKPMEIKIKDNVHNENIIWSNLNYSNNFGVGSYFKLVNDKYYETDKVVVSFPKVNSKKYLMTEISDLKFFIVKDRIKK